MPYAGQTKNKFSTQWNNHRSFWNRFNVKIDNDQTALKHFYKSHFHVLNAKPDITECCMVIFVEPPDKTLLDWCKNKWIDCLNIK